MSKSHRAVKAVLSGRMDVKAAATHFGLAKSTLYYHVGRARKAVATTSPDPKPRRAKKGKAAAGDTARRLVKVVKLQTSTLYGKLAEAAPRKTWGEPIDSAPFLVMTPNASLAEIDAEIARHMGLLDSLSQLRNERAESEAKIESLLRAISAHTPDGETN